MNFALTLRPAMHLECVVCGEHMCRDEDDDIDVEIVLFGVKRFAVCIGCRQKVEPHNQTDDYKLRYARRERELHKTTKEKR